MFFSKQRGRKSQRNFNDYSDLFQAAFPTHP